MDGKIKISFLTTDDPLYLPAFFGRVLGTIAPDTAGVCVSPLYKRQTDGQAAWHYYRTFGLEACIGLGTRVARAKVYRETIQRVCHDHGVDCATVADVNAPAFLKQLQAAGTDLLVSVSCPQLLKHP